MKSTQATLATRIGLVAVTVAISMGLAGCIQSSTALPGSKPGATTGSSATPKASVTPTATQSPTKFAEDCNILLTPAQVYDYNPNFVVDPAYTPTPASVPAAIAAAHGQTCGWINETSGTHVEVAITALNQAQWQAARTAAAGGTPIDADGSKGFFAVKNGVGSAQLFFGSIWLDVSSTDFASVADAEALYPIVVKNQRHAGG